MNTLVAASIFSITLNPLLYKYVDPVAALAMRQPRLRGWLTTRVLHGENVVVTGESAEHRAVVVGYGPVGETVSRLLRENAVEPTVIELNLETVRRLRDAGIKAVYGDASLPATLASANVAQAGSLILSASGVRNCEQVIRLARQLNPAICVLARSDYVREIAGLQQAGAARVFSGEGEVALALIEEILRPLGATGEQIDRERDRFRREVLARQNENGTSKSIQ
jgi:CPA2 family monovalent cation:H+ antiporter-2